ncbi:1395_t:CDS:2, partial [Acaulospora colombiana]
KLIASGEFVDVKGSATQGGNDNAPPESARSRKKMSLLKRIYRLPMDFLEEVTTSASDLILVNSKFTARVFDAYFPSIKLDEAGRRINPNRSYAEEKERKVGGPRVVYPGIDLNSYERSGPPRSEEEKLVYSERPTFLSLNRFEGKKNLALAIEAFAGFLRDLSSSSSKNMKNTRLVLGGGFDPRLKDNIDTFNSLLHLISSLSLSWCMLTSASNQSKLPQIPADIPPQTSVTSAQVVLLPNFTTAQRSILLTSSSTLALLYTPTNEHFGIVPVEAMACGLPVVACKSGGPLETVVDKDNDQNESGERRASGEGEMGWSVVDLPSQTSSSSQPPSNQRTGWLLPPVSSEWTTVLGKIVSLSQTERKAISERAKTRARQLFSMEAMTDSLEKAIEDAYEMGPVGWTEIINFEWMVKVYVVLISLSILLLGGFWTVAWTGGVLVTTVIYKRVKLDARQ